MPSRQIGFKPNHRTDDTPKPITRDVARKLNLYKLAFNEFLFDAHDGVNEAEANQNLFDRIRSIQKLNDRG